MNEKDPKIANLEAQKNWEHKDSQRSAHKALGGRRFEERKADNPENFAIAGSFELTQGIDNQFSRDLLNVALILSDVSDTDNIGEILNKVKRLNFTTETDNPLPFGLVQKNKGRHNRIEVMVDYPLPANQQGRIIIPIRLKFDDKQVAILFAGNEAEFQEFAGKVIKPLPVEDVQPYLDEQDNE